jgi:hypothetical protein
VQDDETPPSHLHEIIEAINETLNEKPGELGMTDLERRRADIQKVARFLVATYGERALERARLLERRRQDSGFARAVRSAVERLSLPLRSSGGCGLLWLLVMGSLYGLPV